MTAFDTLSAAHDLEAAGFERAKAEAVAHAVASAGAAGCDDLATKADLEQLRTATKADLEQLGTATKTDLEQLGTATKTDLEHLRTATKVDLAELRTDLYKVALGIVVAMGAVMFGLLKLLLP